MKTLAIIGTVIPEPESTAAGNRMMQLIDLFQEQGYAITFLTASAQSDYSFDLKSKNVNVHHVLLNDSSFDTLLKELQPQIVIFDRYITEEQFGWRVSEVCPKALKILDTEDLHFLRKAREEAHRNGKEVEQADLLTDIFKREMASILRCDLSLIISEFEMKLLLQKFGIDERILHYLPLFADARKCKSNFGQRKNFVSIGNFLHSPNWFTVLKLKELWPQIRKNIPDAELHIYGAYPGQKAFQLHNEKEGFLVKGRTENVESLFEQMRVLLAPIPFGAGIKGKLLDSMKFGLPNVTTSFGAEGMTSKGKWNGFIAKHDIDFVKKATELYKSESVWNDSREAGYRIIKERFSKDDFAAPFAQRFIKLCRNIDVHRQTNFLGQILQFHTVQSTKYLSRWIEEKNRKQS